MSDAQVLVQTKGWNPDTQRDEQLLFDGKPMISLSLMLPISPTEGKWFTANTWRPDVLWEILMALGEDEDKAARDYFDYSGPPKSPPPKSADDMLKELETL